VNISGPSPIAIVHQPDESGHFLRLNQRFAAEVMQVSGDRVVLAINGVQVVARLTSAEQAAQLIERRHAQFLVKDLSHSSVMLQIVSQGGENSISPANALADLLPNLLRNAGLPVNDTNLMIARSLLSNGLPITAQFIEEMESLLNLISGWKQKEADAAAVLKSAGLPVTPDTIQLASSGTPNLVVLVSELYTAMQRLLAGKIPIEYRENIQSVLSFLEKMIFTPQHSGDGWGSTLQEAVKALGKSLEQYLLNNEHLIPKGQEKSNGLLTIINLRNSLVNSNWKDVVVKIDQFLDGLRLLHLVNAEPDQMPLKEQWLRLDIPLTLLDNWRNQGVLPDLHSARLRIAYKPEGDNRFIDARNTHFIIRVDLSLTEVVQVDVSVAEKRVGIEVTASNEALVQRSLLEMDTLQDGLDRLGYHLHTAHCHLADEAMRLGGETPGWRSFNEVQVEI